MIYLRNTQESRQSGVYKQSQKIEQRLAELLRLLGTSRYSSPNLAATLHVSVPTISRSIAALRDRGYDIRAIKRGDGWFYVLSKKQKLEAEQVCSHNDESENNRAYQNRMI